MTKANFTTPVGRLVWGSVSKAKDKDAEGKPLVVKHGPSAGQPRVEYAFGLAIPKGVESHWSQTPWGKLIWDTGHAAFPQGQGNAPTFAWKVTDGDSQVPNRTGKKPCDREGYPRHWVLSFSSSYPPKCFNSNGTAPVENEAVKTGYYVQVAGNVDGNGSANQPGVYLNHNMVALSAYGEEIVSGPDVASAGFGQGVTLPPGASATPIGGLPATGAPAPMPTNTVGLPTPTTAAAPHYPILGVGAPAAVAPPVPVPAAAAPPVPVAPPARTMTPKANGIAYEAYIAQGWTDDLLRSNGMML